MTFHPDKNRNPKAAEAFKKVSAAYHTLSNPEKRRVYDMNPDLNIFNAPTASSSAGGHHPFYADDAFDAEDLFAHIFGEAVFPPHHRRRRHSHPFTRPPPNNQPREPPSLKTILLQLLPVIFLFLFSGVFTTRKEPVYSLDYSNKYNVKMQTRNIKVPFYVGSSFAGLSNEEMREVSGSVEREYLELLQHRCYHESQQRTYYGEREVFDGPRCREYWRVKHLVVSP